MLTTRRAAALAVLVALAQLGAGAQAPTTITPPKASLGFEIGDDYQLANYTQLSAYWKTLERESDRIRVVEYGRTSEGRPMLMAIVTSPGNLKNLDRYRGIARRLALAEGLSDEQVRGT
jgi:hypothetical protein